MSYFAYIRESYGNLRGAIYVTEDDHGNFGVGISMCSPKDVFSKETARKIAEERALECLKKHPFTFYDIMDERVIDYYTENPIINKFEYYNVIDALYKMIREIVNSYARKWYLSIR